MIVSGQSLIYTKRKPQEARVLKKKGGDVESEGWTARLDTRSRVKETEI